jgi:hypothetical protein
MIPFWLIRLRAVKIKATLNIDFINGFLRVRKKETPTQGWGSKK